LKKEIGILQKSILIYIGIQPPKWHDVIDIIIDNLKKFPEEFRNNLLLSQISHHN